MLLWTRQHWRQLLTLALLILLPLFVLGKLADDIREREVFGFDAPVTLWLRANAPAWFRQVALVLSAFGSATWMTPVSALLLVVFWRKSAAMGRYFLFSLGGVMLLNILLKALIGRVRPQIVAWLWQEGDKSFPSGHATMAAALTVTLVALLWRTGWRWPLIVVGTLYTLLMGTARVYVGVHYPTDVLGGWALGVGWAAGTALVLWPRLRQAQQHAEQPGAVAHAD
ncbi:phosphatase PAP2 family protein [Deinococcus rubellus]|uniref:Phosphatase PAP2 family protein n=1 Tax=Deinococcus rubellus TaxID=1889240 RepID=A0ABY5YH33_9DEIO|nr:phosphatase PAP2 family protein [Deinococcus rubellus]UWX64430.1 phosphatase PAP2 family protein [Deinococcus rubellus]